MSLLYRILADIVVTAHVAYVAFVVLGLVAIWYGILRKREWARSRVLRYTHLAMILIVVTEAWIGMTCPLTTWEQWLRTRAGQAAYQGDFIANWLHELLFFDAPPGCSRSFTRRSGFSCWRHSRSPRPGRRRSRLLSRHRWRSPDSPW